VETMAPIALRLCIAVLGLLVRTTGAWGPVAGSHMGASSMVATRRSAPVMMPPMPAPATKTRQKVVTKPKTADPVQGKPSQKTNIAKPKRQTSSAYVPMWKVLLLGDEEYEEDPVVGVIVEVLPEIPMDEARRKFAEAQAKGDSLLTVVNQEHAEAYVSQFHRSTPMVFADAQPE